MAGDYIPRPDADFDPWANNFVTRVTGEPTSVGLVAADVTALTGLLGTWTDTYGDHNNAAANLKNLRLQKDEARHALEEGIRAVARRIQAVPNAPDGVKASLGLTVRDTTATPAAAPATRPVATVDTGERLRHTVHFRDEASPRSKAKPRGTKGCEIWVKVGAPPANVSGSGTGDLAFLALDTATPYVAEWDEADAGQTAYYMLRWVSTRDEKGPWSETVEATIVG